MSKKKTQKILIKKGTIDPNEDTLIEIPVDLKDKPIVVARKHGHAPQEKSISIETSSKNAEFNGDRGSVSENRSKVKIVKEPDSNFAPKHHSSSENLQKFEASLIERKFMEMQEAKKELEESVFLSAAASKLSNKSRKDSSALVTNETLARPVRTVLSNTASCDKSLQCKTSKPQSSHRSPLMADVSTNFSFSNPEVPSLSSTRKNGSSASVSFKESNCKGSQRFEEDDLNLVGIRTAKSGRRKETKTSCGNCDKTSTLDDWNNEDLITGQDKIKKIYKYSSSDIDDLYIEQLTKQFDEAKRKLNEAVTLAALSLKQLGNRKHASPSRLRAASGTALCDSVPERDISFIPLCGSQHSCVVFIPGPSKNPSGGLDVEQARWPTPDPTISDSYKNIPTKRNSESQSLKSDSAGCSFLKKPILSSNRSSIYSFTLRKDINTQTDGKLSVDKPGISTRNSVESRCSGCCQKTTSTRKTL